jgi:hypothetical protein
MLISLAPNTTPAGPPVYLAGRDPAGRPDARCGPKDLKVTERRAVQVAELFRANTVQVFDRLNRRVSIVFSVQRLFDTVAAAQNFVLDHPGLVPTSGTVIVTNEGDAGGVPQRFYPDAVVEVVDGSHLGLATRHHYQITAAAAQNQDPSVAAFSPSN